MQWAIVVYTDNKHTGVVAVHGPFPSKDEAIEWTARAAKTHPDATWEFAIIYK